MKELTLQKMANMVTDASGALYTETLNLDEKVHIISNDKSTLAHITDILLKIFLNDSVDIDVIESILEAYRSGDIICEYDNELEEEGRNPYKIFTKNEWISMKRAENIIKENEMCRKIIKELQNDIRDMNRLLVDTFKKEMGGKSSPQCMDDNDKESIDDLEYTNFNIPTTDWKSPEAFMKKYDQEKQIPSKEEKNEDPNPDHFRYDVVKLVRASSLSDYLIKYESIESDEYVVSSGLNIVNRSEETDNKIEFRIPIFYKPDTGNDVISTQNLICVGVMVGVVGHETTTTGVRERILLDNYDIDMVGWNYDSVREKLKFDGSHYDIKHASFLKITEDMIEKFYGHTILEMPYDDESNTRLYIINKYISKIISTSVQESNNEIQSKM